MTSPETPPLIPAKEPGRRPGQGPDPVQGQNQDPVRGQGQEPVRGQGQDRITDPRLPSATHLPSATRPPSASHLPSASRRPGQSDVLRLGTRGSALAVAQSTLVAEALERALGVRVELVRVRTEGDRLTGSLAALGGAGVFVAALREALLDGRCDLAVHSLKDLPTADTPGLLVAAVPERADPRDALCARDGLTLTRLPYGARIGTGSPRRAAQLRALRPDVEVVDIRGNVDTRLGRVPGLQPDGPGDLDAVVLAAAGLSRLGRLESVSELLAPSLVAPAPGQGALAVECRAADTDLVAGLAVLDDLSSRLAVTAERALLAALEAGCAAPVGALGKVRPNGVLVLDAVVCRPDGGARLARQAALPVAGLTGHDAVATAAALGTRLAGDLLSAGAAELAPLGPGASPGPDAPGAPDAGAATPLPDTGQVHQ